MGRPVEKDGQLLFELDKGNIFTMLFNHIPDIKIEHCEAAIPEHKKRNFICQLCKDVFSLRTVSTGCHYYCASCLSNMFIANK